MTPPPHTHTQHTWQKHFAAYFAWVCTHISTCRVCSRGSIANDSGVTFLGACHCFLPLHGIGLCLSHIHGVLSRTFQKSGFCF